MCFPSTEAAALTITARRRRRADGPAGPAGRSADLLPDLLSRELRALTLILSHDSTPERRYSDSRRHQGSAPTCTTTRTP